MRHRVEQTTSAQGVYVSTFHSLCVWILRRYAEYAQIQSNFSIFDPKDQQRCMKEAISDCQIDATNFTPARMLDFISRLKNDLEDAEQFEARADDFFSKNAAKVYARYQQLMKKNNALDFDDLLVQTAFLLRDHEEVRLQLRRSFQIFAGGRVSGTPTTPSTRLPKASLWLIRIFVLRVIPTSQFINGEGRILEIFSLLRRIGQVLKLLSWKRTSGRPEYFREG